MQSLIDASLDPAFETPAAPATGRVLPRRRVVLYALPLLGVGGMWNLIGFYFMKHATDVLLIAPVTMGGIFLVSRVWDAVSDPLVGYWSDCTASRLGRRRPWMLGAAAPLGALFVAMWYPPRALGPEMLVLWTGAAVVLFFTALTAFAVPHRSLGAELSPETHERTRLFAAAQMTEVLGATLAIGGLFALLAWGVQPRTVGLLVAGGLALAAIGLTLAAIPRLHEDPRNQAHAPSRLAKSARDVWQNPHARRLLLSGLLQAVGLSTLIATIPYVSEYVLGDLTHMARILLAFVVPHVLLLPAWLPLSRRFGKRETWMVARSIEALAIGGLLFAPGLGLWAVLVLAAIAGGMDGSASVLWPSLQADIVDYDEYHTGERKQGVYFATAGLVGKCAAGVGVMLMGGMLELSGFEPNVAQNESALLGLRVLISLVPCTLVFAGVFVMLGFRLDENTQRNMRAELDRRDT